MQRSTERILTTHTGSLPRPAELTTLLEAKEHKQPYDTHVFAD
jgi:5-methyltetrahydropteroyltriglutamate--homocysteine methyltransferase